MNLNCKLTFTDEQRNNIKRNITGKDVKALATRAEICELVNDLLEAFTSRPKPPPGPALDHPAGCCQKCGCVVQMTEPRCGCVDVPDQGDVDFCSDDCCRRNELLQRRVNILQHRLDTGR